MIVVFFQWSTNSRAEGLPSQSPVKSRESPAPPKEASAQGSRPPEPEAGKAKPEKDLRELGKNFFFLVANYHQFELLDYYIKPKSPFDAADVAPLEKWADQAEEAVGRHRARPAAARAPLQPHAGLPKVLHLQGALTRT